MSAGKKHNCMLLSKIAERCVVFCVIYKIKFVVEAE